MRMKVAQVRPGRTSKREHSQSSKAKKKNDPDRQGHPPMAFLENPLNHGHN